ncbi:uncharacterized protein LOC134778973 isoform X2 [Penaeus indicus]|uniref:uncharacterized protein LOC134778973 isoform X2 n=1 Tax=Penaeus indicus TaxID=29960 RepID=UPI00300C2582
MDIGKKKQCMFIKRRSKKSFTIKISINPSFIYQPTGLRTTTTTTTNNKRTVHINELKREKQTNKQTAFGLLTLPSAKMTTKRQKAFCTFCIAVWSIGWTTLSAPANSTPSSEGQTNHAESQVDPCAPMKLFAHQSEKEEEKSVLLFEVETAGICTKPKCAGIFIKIRKCHETNGGSFTKAQMKGRFCASDTGCYKVACGNITSNTVTLLGLSEITVEIRKPVFRNSTLVETAVNSMDPRVTGFKYDILDNVTWEKLSKGKIPDRSALLEVKVNGSFVSGKCYTFRFKPIANIPGCKEQASRSVVKCYNATETTEMAYETQPGNSSTVILQAACLSIIVIVCFVVTVAIYRRKKVGIEQHGRRGDRTSRANRVLVIHALDDYKLQEKCTELCIAISSHLAGSIQVQDIYLTKDTCLLQDPQAWVTDKVIAPGTDEGGEQGITKIILVLSPLMEHLRRALDEEKDDFDFFGRQPHPHDPVLKTFLRHLATPELKMDYKRLSLVRFSDLHEHWSGDFQDLVPGKRFILPHHEDQLLDAIGQKGPPL